MRKLFLHIIISVLMLAGFTTCKKVTEKVNAEKSFIFFFADKSSGFPKVQCFDEIYGLNNAPLKSCSDLSGLELPLSIVDTSSIFLFVKDSKIDTVRIDYSKRYRSGTGQYEVNYVVKRINTFNSGRFDSLSTKCIPELSIYCNGNEGLFAIVYL